MLAALVLALIPQAIEAAAGLQPFSDGTPKIQLAGVAGVLPLGGKLTVDLPGNRLNHGDGSGNLRVFKLGNIAIQQAKLRVSLVHADAGVLHLHLLFQQRPGEYGVDEIAVKLGIPVNIPFVLVQNIPQLQPLFFRHGSIDFPQIFPQIHRLAPNLQIFLRLPPSFFQLCFPLHLFLRLLAHDFLRDKKAVKDPVKGT